MRQEFETAWSLIKGYFDGREYQPGEFTVQQNLMRHFEDNGYTGGDAEAFIDHFVELRELIRSPKNPRLIAVRNKSRR